MEEDNIIIRDLRKWVSDQAIEEYYYANIQAGFFPMFAYPPKSDSDIFDTLAALTYSTCVLNGLDPANKEVTQVLLYAISMLPLWTPTDWWPYSKDQMEAGLRSVFSEKHMEYLKNYINFKEE